VLLKPGRRFLDQSRDLDPRIAPQVPGAALLMNPAQG